MKLAVLIISILISLPVFTQANDYVETSKQLKSLTGQFDVLVIGERHGEQDSTELLTALTDHFTQNNTFLSIALEIGSDQQSVIDNAMSGDGIISDIKISPIVDHQYYRAMLLHLKNMITDGRHIQVVAIDGCRNGESRDAWMAESIGSLIDNGKVLCLVGNFHAIKKIRWASGDHNPFMAEILCSKGYSVCSVMQLWDEKGDGTVSRLTIDDAAIVLYPVVAHMPKKASEFGDYVIRWK